MSLKLPLTGDFPANFVPLSGHNARIVPSEMNEIDSKIRRPANNIFCGKGSKSSQIFTSKAR